MRARKSTLTSTVVGSALLAGVVVGAPGADAAGIPAPSTNPAACAAQQPGGAGTDMVQVDGATADQFRQRVAAALDSGAVRTAAPRDAIKMDKAKVYGVSSAGANLTSVTVPVGGGYSRISNVTVVFSADGSVLQSGETLISENADGNFTISNFTGSELVRRTDTDLAFVTDAELATTAAPAAQVSSQSVGSTVACVATVLGVSGGTAYLIVGACAGACTVPVVGTAICVACIGAYATVGGASIAAVASCF